MASSQLSCAGDRPISEPAYFLLHWKFWGFLSNDFSHGNSIAFHLNYVFKNERVWECSNTFLLFYFFLPRWNILVNSTSPYFPQMLFYRTGFFPLSVFRFYHFLELGFHQHLCCPHEENKDWSVMCSSARWWRWPRASRDVLKGWVGHEPTQLAVAMLQGIPQHWINSRDSI